MSTFWKRSVSLLLVLSMVLGVMPGAFATEMQEPASLGEEKTATRAEAEVDPSAIALAEPIHTESLLPIKDPEAYEDLTQYSEPGKYFLYAERVDGDTVIPVIISPKDNRVYHISDKGISSDMGAPLLSWGDLLADLSAHSVVIVADPEDPSRGLIANCPDPNTVRYLSSDGLNAGNDPTAGNFVNALWTDKEENALLFSYGIWDEDGYTSFMLVPGHEQNKGHTVERAIILQTERYGSTPSYYRSYALGTHSSISRTTSGSVSITKIPHSKSIYLAVFGKTVDTTPLYEAIQAAQGWWRENRSAFEDYNPAMVVALRSAIVEAADFYNNVANGAPDTVGMQTKIAEAIQSVKKLVSSTTMSKIAVDIPVTFYDFRSDGLMFEAGGGAYYSYMMETPGYSPEDVPPFPGTKGGTLTSAGYGTKTTGLVEDELVKGQLVYKEETVEYIAWLIARGYRREFGNNQGLVNRELYKKVGEIASAAGTDAESAEFKAALGTWEKTLSKTDTGENGGFFPYKEVETAFDLAYYITTNMWRSVPTDDIMETVTANSKNYALPYNLTVDSYDYLRLVKNPESGAYEISSNKLLTYVEGSEYSVGAIYNPDLSEEQPISEHRMRFIPMGGEPREKEAVPVSWKGFDGLDRELPEEYRTFEDNTDPDFGGQGFHFAMHAKGSFVYRKALNQYFYFLGDDDVYYFLDGKLVMDIGGGHPACDDILYLNDVAKKLGMVDGGVYSFDMFYIERHTTQSNMTFSTNIKIMDTDTFTSERQFNASKGMAEIPAGGKIDVGDTVIYQYELLNSRDVPVENLVFLDKRLGVTLSGTKCILDGEPANLQEGGNEEFDPANLTLIYRGINGSGEPAPITFEEIRGRILTTLDASTTNGIYPAFDANANYSVTGLTSAQIMELLALGLPVNCSIAIRGLKRNAKDVDQPFYSELFTSCEYEKAVVGDESYDTRTIFLTGSATVSTMVRPDPVFNANKLRYVVDYGKPLEMKLDKIEECVIVPESPIYRAEKSLFGVTDRGTHGQVSMEAPRSLGATAGSNEVYDCSSAFGSFKRESNALYYTPGQFLENVATAYAVFRIRLTYMDPNTNFNTVLQNNNGVDVTADYYITVSLEIIPATMMYYEAEDFFGSEITYEELPKGGTVNTTPGTKTDSDLGKGTITDPTPAQDIHYAEGKAKDYPGNHVLIDFDQDEESAGRYTDKAYYFAQEQINWDDSANWKNGTVANGVITGALLETNRDKAMLNLPIRYASFVEAKLRATETGTVKMTLITLKHTGVVEELPLSSLNIGIANADYWYCEDLSNNEVVKAGLNTLVGLKIEGPAGLAADYIFVGPYDLSPGNQNAAPYFLEDFEGYESEDSLNEVWKVTQSLSTCKDTFGSCWGELQETDIGTKSIYVNRSELPASCNCVDQNHLASYPSWKYFGITDIEAMPGTLHLPLSKAPYIEILVKVTTELVSQEQLYCYLTLSNGKQIMALNKQEMHENMGKYVLLTVDLTELTNYDVTAYITGIRLRLISNLGLSGSIAIDHIYIGQRSDSSSSGPAETPVIPSQPSAGFGQSLLANFEQTPYWEYWKLKDNDGFKKGSEPELMADTDDAGNAIKVMHMEFDNPGSAESRFRIDGLDIGGAVNPTLDIRMKITDLFKWSGFQGNDPLSFKVELTMSDGSTITLSRPVPEENVGKYIVYSFDLNGILTENGPKLRSLVLHFDAYTSLPQHIYLDYVYVGDSNARPGEASEAYVAEVPNVLLQMEYPSEPLDNPANWFCYPEWPVNDWGSNDVPGNKKPGQPLFIREEGIGALKFTYTSNSWRSQLEGSVSAGDGIPVRDAQYIEVRLKLSNIQPAMYGSGAPALMAKLLTKNGSLNGETFNAGTIYVGDQYVVISNENWINDSRIMQSNDTLLGLRLYFEPTTDFPLEIYLDYVYVGPKADAPSQSDGIRQSYEEIYGFDSTYTNDRYLSNGESLYIEGKGNRMEPTAQQYEEDPSTANGIVPGTGSYSEFKFSFTGTGFDLISRTGAQQGTVRVSVYTAEQRLQENRIKAITVFNKGELELFQIPVVSIQGLPYATYYVVVGVSAPVSIANVRFGSQFYFDALRIYDPIDTAANEDVLNAYRADGEAYVHVKEIRDTLLDASDFASPSLGNSMEGAMFVDTSYYDTSDSTQPSEPGGSTTGTTPADTISVTDHLAANVSTYNKMGPKNEIYLSPGQAVAFRLVIDSEQRPTSIDVGAKSILGDRSLLSAGFVVSGGNDVLESLNGTAVSVVSSAALYYPLSLATLPTEEDRDIYLVIYNAYEGSDKTRNILSITDLKVCYDEAPVEKLPADDDLNEPEIHSRATHRKEGMETPYRFAVDGRTLEAAAVHMRAYWETPILESNSRIMHSLNLASDISINYIVAKSELADCESFYLECVQPLYKGNDLVGQRVHRLEPEDRGSFYYFTLDGLIATQMSDTLRTTLYTRKDGRNYYSHTDYYSIAQYAYSQLDKEIKNEAIKLLCADLLRYGKEAQLFKSYRTDALADAAMTEAHRAYLRDAESVTFGETNEILADLENPSVTWVGKALNLESKVSVQYVFTTEMQEEELGELTMKVNYVNHMGQPVELTVKDVQVYDATKNRYFFAFDGLLAAELRSITEVAVYRGDVRLSQTLRYSPDTYGRGKTGKLLDLCKALFAYADSAKDFFA